MDNKRKIKLLEIKLDKLIYIQQISNNFLNFLKNKNMKKLEIKIIKNQSRRSKKMRNIITEIEKIRKKELEKE